MDLINENINTALLAFIPALLNVVILFYILFELPKSRTMDIFTFIVFALVLWQMEDGLLRLVKTADEARFWDSILCLGWLSIGPLSIHFAGRFASIKKLQTRTSLILLYFPLLFFYVLYQANIQGAVYIHDETWGWVNKPRPGTLEELQRLWLSIMIICSIIILVHHAFKVNKAQKKLAWIIAIGIIIPAIQGILTQVVFPVFLSIKEIPLTSSFMTIFSIATIMAMSRYKLFQVSESLHSDRLLESLNRLVLIISLDKKIVYMNKYASQILGISHEGAEKVPFEKIFPVGEPDFRKYGEEVFDKVVKGEAINNYSCRFQTAGEEWINVIMSSSLVVNNNVKLGVLLFANDITQMVTALKDLELERLKREKEIAEASIVAQEKERKELGGELHDNINQILASALLYLSMMKKPDNEQVPFLSEVSSLLNSAIQEIRKLSHTLIAPSLEDDDLTRAIDNIVSIAEKTGTMTIDKKVYGINENSIPDKLKLNVYRIVQEQFNNIIKYSKAQNVSIRLRQEENKLTLHIKDDGIGFDMSSKAEGRGIGNLKDRATSNNGSIEIISSPGEGCELNVVFEDIAN